MLVFGACLVCVNLATMNQIATSATTSRRNRVRTDPSTTTQMIDLTTPAPTTKNTRSPTKSAIQALEGITASLPSSLHPLALHFGNKLISIRSKRITKENIAKRMTKEANYIPKSAKATDFKITISKGASEDSERVSFLEQQIQQAKDTYESSLKNVIEECISLETSALQSQENKTIYTLLASITKAINTLEGLKMDVHQKVISLIYLDCSFISYTTSTSWDSFISSYCTHHNLETIPTPTIHPISKTHVSANERDTELLLHTKSLQRHENNGLQTFRKAIEGIIIAISVSYEKQIEENNRDIILKKLSNDIILGKATESTAMELDAEGGASFEQLQELIKKECDKHDKNYRSNTTNSRSHVNNPNKKTRPRGAKEAPQTKKSHPHPRLEKLNHNAAGLPQNVECNNKALDNLTNKKEKPTIPPTLSQTNMEEAPCGTGAHDHN